MKSILIFLCVTATVVNFINADVYLHSPRGSNNRLNEKSANRKNANRVFDSQNNNRGGYNVGDETDQAAKEESGQYNMEFFQSGPKHKGEGNEGKSFLTIEWTNQHGCGGSEDKDPHKLNCNLVLQYMCEPDVKNPGKFNIRNGKSTSTQGYNNQKHNTKADKKTRKEANVNENRAIQEPWEWYDKCDKRQRNKGLFTADQKLRGESSKHTRQNPGGTRYGYECPEERDYYPYWHPTDWKDIAVFVHDKKLCDYYQTESFNVKPKGECMEKYGGGGYKHASKYNQNSTCVEGGGEWFEFSNYLEEPTVQYNSKEACEGASTKDIPLVWGIPYRTQDLDTKPLKEKCLVGLDKPHCELSPWSRDNHLGNGRDGVPLNYTWVLPHFQKEQRCIFRIRYNISTDDYDPFNTNSSHNQNLAGMVISPVQQNELVDIGAAQTPLRLAINTAQYGRTFQDRSHVFKLKKRPAGIADTRTIYNLNVRGKRGNIVQTYPAVEYDFIPNKLTLMENDLVHIQWTGSNTHNNGNPAGDGQAGNAGEGREGTDRNNIVEVLDPIDNYPVPFENSTMFSGAKLVWSSSDQTKTLNDVAVSLASVGYYSCLTGCNSSPKKKNPTLNNLLNNAAASYEGMVLQFAKGEYHYICSRNNNFSNRSQKGMITVVKKP